MSAIQDKLIAAGVKNLKAYGYPAVTAENILTDPIYREFFRSMLKENLGQSKSIDTEINAVLARLTLGAV